LRIVFVLVIPPAAWTAGDDRLMRRQHPLVSTRRWSLWQAVTELLWRGRSGRYPLRSRCG
jgi:hypothetical protein